MTEEGVVAEEVQPVPDMGESLEELMEEPRGDSVSHETAGWMIITMEWRARCRNSLEPAPDPFFKICSTSP